MPLRWSKEAEAADRCLDRGRWLIVALLVMHMAVLTARPAHSEPLRLGFSEPVTDSSDPRVFLVRYQGPIDHPMAANLEEIGKQIDGRHTALILDLDSRGGTVAHATLVIEVLNQLRGRIVIHTIVRHGRNCLSACIPVFMQGQRRQAGGASVWMFHGACAPYSNVPSEKATQWYLELLASSGVSEAFLCALKAKGAFSGPGGYWMSGYELFHEQEAGIITELLPSWQPEPEISPPFDRQLRPR
jgi:hypothetical protein